MVFRHNGNGLRVVRTAIVEPHPGHPIVWVRLCAVVVVLKSVCVCETLFDISDVSLSLC